MPDLSESFVESTALALNSAQIPCVLWGHYLLAVHGVPTAIAVSTHQPIMPRISTNALKVY
jgi:hypothetical protein